MTEYIKSIRAKIGNDLLMAAAAGTLIFDSGGRVLLMRHMEGGGWSGPGGMIEPFESPSDAAVRETWEELGVLVQLSGLIGVFGGPDHYIKYRSGDEVAYISVVFEATITDGQPRPDGGEALELGWFSRDEALRLSMSPQNRRQLEAAFARKATSVFDSPTWTPPTTSAGT